MGGDLGWTGMCSRLGVEVFRADVVALFVELVGLCFELLRHGV
jgi:hypothetical protein